jgi:hypothetical protein
MIHKKGNRSRRFEVRKIKFNKHHKRKEVVVVYTNGREFEKEVLGCCSDSLEYWLLMLELCFLRLDPKWKLPNPKLIYREVLSSQPKHWDPKCPQNGVKKLFDLVKERLPKQESNNLRVFVSVNTKLDYLWGIDMWFETAGVIVTVDFTISHNKSCKADIWVPADVFHSDLLYKKADEVVLKIKEKIKERKKYKKPKRYHELPEELEIEEEKSA